MAAGFSMSWFRLRRRATAWLALLSLALQLGLSFGHVHGLSGDHPAPSLTAAGISQPAPSKNDTGDRDDDYCAICAVLALLSGGQTATAPTLALPVAVPSAAINDVAGPVRAGVFASAFNSRAPPLS